MPPAQVAIASFATLVAGHGYITEPPSRAAFGICYPVHGELVNLTRREAKYPIRAIPVVGTVGGFNSDSIIIINYQISIINYLQGPRRLSPKPLLCEGLPFPFNY